MRTMCVASQHTGVCLACLNERDSCRAWFGLYASFFMSPLCVGLGFSIFVGVEWNMTTWELLLIAVGLSMDAFAVSICKGLSSGRASLRHCAAAGLYFGGFQALMPFLGYALGRQFQSLITSFDHWIAFVLLCFIGANMIRESRSEGNQETADFSPRAMLPLAVATSIDALAVGVTFAFLQVDIALALPLIGCVTFLFSFAGVKLGHVLGHRCKAKAELLGGLVLILIGLKILLEHLGLLG